MNSPDTQCPVPVFHGVAQNASCRDQLVARYRENPVIEALPDILSAENAARLLAHYPEREPKAHKLPPEIRMHLIMDALHFFEPLPVHIDLEQRISRVVRDGYAGRNPAAREHWREMETRGSAIIAGEIPMRSSNTNGFAIIGLSGVGKTTGVERILQLYPQVIHHSTYGGKPFSRIQLVWLKLTCPHDGSIKGLCLDFFREIDGLLGTDYYGQHTRGGRRTVDELIPAMSRVAWIHCLGLLVVDEIQHLNQAASGGAERMLNFFLQLMNTLGLPVLLIGTYAALQILSRELRQIRRSSGQGDLIWDRMANDDIWQLFCESLWRYQYVTHGTPFSRELSDVVHEESAGIVDFAVKLFLLAQVRAIATGTEKITAAILRSVARDSFKLAQPALHALRTGDMRAVATMTDLHPVDFQSAVHEMRKAALLKSLSQSSRVVSDVNAMPSADSTKCDSTTDASGSCAPAKSLPAGSKSRSATRPTKANQSETKCLLVEIADAGVAKGVSAHSALSRAGLIGHVFDSTGTLTPTI